MSLNNKSNKSNIEVGQIYDSNLYISQSDIRNYIAKTFLPIAVTTTIFAPLERTKTILQTMDLMSIRSSEKIYKFRILFPSTIIFNKNKITNIFSFTKRIILGIIMLNNLNCKKILTYKISRNYTRSRHILSIQGEFCELI